MTQLTYTKKAQDKKAGMTLLELQDFVNEAIHANADPLKPVKITIGFRSQIQTITAESDGE
jgi:hypothetical protein